MAAHSLRCIPASTLLFEPERRQIPAPAPLRGDDLVVPSGTDDACVHDAEVVLVGEEVREPVIAEVPLFGREPGGRGDLSSSTANVLFRVEGGYARPTSLPPVESEVRRRSCS
jgi:hypothetical protein